MHSLRARGADRGATASAHARKHLRGERFADDVPRVEVLDVDGNVTWSILPAQ